MKLGQRAHRKGLLISVLIAAPFAVSAQAAEAAPAAEESVVEVSEAEKKSGKPAETGKKTEATAAAAPAKTPASEYPVDTAQMRFKPGQGLEISSTDGAFSMATRLRAQFLYEFADANEPGLVDSQSLQISRARLQFTGNMWGKHNKYKVELAISPRDENVQPITGSGSNNVATTTPLLDWYMDFDHLRDATLRLGQYKIPFSRQRVISSGDMQMVDRSIANAEFTLDRDIGFDFRSKDLFGLKVLKYSAGVYMGEGRNTSDKTYGAGDFGMMYLGRLEYAPLGNFKHDYSESDLSRESKPRLSFGAAYAFLEDAPGNRGILGSTISSSNITGGRPNAHNTSADIMFKYAGFSLQTEWFWRQFEHVKSTRDGWGAMVQAGYLIGRSNFEVTARFAVVRAYGAISSLPDENAAGAGLNYFMADHNLKVQADFFKIYDPQSLASAENRFRLQLQAAL